DAKIRYRAIRPSGKEGVEVLLRDEEQLAEAKRTLTKNHPDMNFVESDSNGRYALISTFTEQRLQEIRNYAVEQNIT
ncbi:hypothetical protein OFN55_43655, partial [Escherichia coli]|nr:hypothetical protein [Escherichia coli]